MLYCLKAKRASLRRSFEAFTLLWTSLAFSKGTGSLFFFSSSVALKREVAPKIRRFLQDFKSKLNQNLQEQRPDMKNSGKSGHTAKTISHKYAEQARSFQVFMVLWASFKPSSSRPLITPSGAFSHLGTINFKDWQAEFREEMDLAAVLTSFFQCFSRSAAAFLSALACEVSCPFFSFPLPLGSTTSSPLGISHVSSSISMTSEALAGAALPWPWKWPSLSSSASAGTPSQQSPFPQYP